MTLVYFEPLTVAERAVLELAAQGLSTKQIGSARGRSWHTVAMQLESIRTKLQANNTAHAVAIALRQGIIQ